jgi:hypothetical protein
MFTCELLLLHIARYTLQTFKTKSYYTKFDNVLSIFCLSFKRKDFFLYEVFFPTFFFIYFFYSGLIEIVFQICENLINSNNQ